MYKKLIKGGSCVPGIKIAGLKVRENRHLLIKYKLLLKSVGGKDSIPFLKCFKYVALWSLMI